jgi:integrase
MKISLELYRQKKDRNHAHPLVLRFAVNRKTYRYPVDKNMTESEWMYEQKNGYKKTADVLDKERKANILLSEIDPRFWSYDDFCKAMEMPIVSKDAITKLWDKYDQHRDEKYERKQIKWRTRELDTTVRHKVESFLTLPKYKHLNNIHLWTAQELELFESFLLESHPGSTTKIYLETLRTFFSWAVDTEEVIARNPFKKFRIKKGSDSWFPYSYKELAVLLSLVPANDREQFAFNWMKRLLYSGGSDPMDFSQMKWRQVHDEFIQLMRVKVSKSSKAGTKLLYLTPDVLETFTEIIGERGKPDDYVLDVFRKELTERQNIDRHKRFMDKIKTGIRDMLKRFYTETNAKTVRINFVIKRLRPTAAVVANAATNDLNFVSKMLIHSNLSQTDTYMKIMPNGEMRQLQIKYEEALNAVNK